MVNDPISTRMMISVIKKVMIIASVCLLTTVGTYAQISASSVPTWKATVKVIDEGGNTVQGADVTVVYESTNDVHGFTDANGVCVASQAGSGRLGIFVIKPGYYPTKRIYNLGWASQYSRAKWEPTITVILKHILHPIAMYAKTVNLQLPTNGLAIGYDLEVGDWVSPYGKGINSDMIFKREHSQKSFQDYDEKLTLSFSHEGDGIQKALPQSKEEEGTAFRSLYQAPTAGYRLEIVKHNSSHPGQGLVFDYNPDQMYFFRVRTVLDGQGNPKGGLYGKIYGDFMQFSYYLNPNLNDPNVEFDVKHNLIKNLASLESVREP